MAIAAATRPEADPEFAELRAKWKRERHRTVDTEALLYLALVPTWTRQLADYCKFPRHAEWDEFLADAEAAGVVLQEQRAGARAGEQVDLLHFWMPEAVRIGDPQEPEETRGGVLQRVIEARDRSYLVELAARLGKSISRLKPDDPAVPGITRRWAELAREVGPDMSQAEALVRQFSGRPGSRTPDTTTAALELSQRVAALADVGRTGTARAWIDAAKILAAALGGSLEGAVTLSERRVELSYRQDIDRRYLERYVERQDQTDAFRKLMTGPEDLWALHYLGMGGVGKTMLLRHIGYEAPKDYRSPVARVDFDYLSPDYPVRRPGQLLLALAEDLQRHFTTAEHQDAYSSLHDALLYLHEVISGEPPPTKPLANLHRDEFDKALDLFADLLRSLLRTADEGRDPGDPPTRVVLVLDTCEELVRSPFGDRAIFHLAATFELLERVKQRTPALRVIFAGRSLLALGGNGWHAAADQLPQVKSYLPPPKPYLRLHLIRGFDEGEAQQFFDVFETPERPLPAEIRQAILSVSADHGTPAALLADNGHPLLFPPPLYEQLYAALDTPFARDQMRALEAHEQLGPILRSLTGTDRVKSAIETLADETNSGAGNLLVLLLAELARKGQSSVPQDIVAEIEGLLIRYSPFSLNIYSQWYVDEQELTAAQIRDGFDPYVELRIVRRITQEQIRRLLPAVVLLRRFNDDMLRPAYTGMPDDYKAAFLALSDLEWLDYRRDPETHEIWLAVDPNFYPRLRTYFERAESDALADASRLLRPELVDAVRSRPLANLAREEIVATLDLLPEAEAVDLWSEVEWRVPTESDWSWGLRVTRMALAAEADAVPSPRPLVVAALSATQAAANIHLSSTYDATTAWQRVADALAQLAGSDVDEPLARWLGARAVLGQAAAARLRGAVPDPDTLDAIRDLLTERVEQTGPLASLQPHQIQQLDAALYAALEAWVDAVEEAGNPSLLGSGLDVDLRTLGEKALDPQHHIFALLLEGRITAQLGNGDRSRAALVEAEALATDTLPDTAQPGPWADWRAPNPVRERVWLEWLRLRPDLPMTKPDELLGQRQLEGWLQDLVRVEALAKIDGERLASAALSRLLDSQPVPADLLTGIEKAYRYDPTRQPTCLVHRLAPPLFLALARGWLALGEADRAEKLLLEIQESATTAALDASSVDAAEQGLIELARRTRDVEKARLLLERQGSKDWPNPDAWALAALTGALAADRLPAPSETWDDTRLHAWWRVQSSLQPDRLDQVGEVLRRITGVDLPVQDDDSEFSLIDASVTISSHLDARELALISGREERDARQRVRAHYLLLRWLTSAPRSEQRPGEAREMLRFLLRFMAVGNGLDSAFLTSAGWLSPPRTGIGISELSRLIPGSVGVRRAAEIALDEGELLALRLPGLAAPLLQQAHDWFREAGDLIGATQSAVLWTLASLRAGDTHKARGARAVRDALLACRSTYKELTETQPEDRLPDWSLIQDQARSGERGILDQVGTYWRAWIARIMAAGILADAQPLRPESEKWPPIVAKLASLELRPVPPELLPTDLAEAVEPSTDWDFLDTWWGILALTGGVLIFFAGILVGLFFGFRALLALGAPELAGNTGISIGIYIATLLLLALLRPGTRRLRRSLAGMLLSRAEIRLEISATSAASENGSPMADLLLSCQERRLRLLPPSMPWTVTETVQEQIVLSANVPYASMAEQLANAEIIGRLADLASRAGRWGIVVRLAVPAELSSHPWEAWLRMAVVEGKTQQLPSTVSDEVRRRAESLTLNLVRTGQQAKALTMAQPFADGGVRVTVGETWAGLFGAAWGRAFQRERLGVGPVAHQLGKDEAVRVLHVIGHPIRTRSGPRIQVATGGFDVSDAMSQTSSRAGAELVGTGDLTQAALRRAGRLVILQAVPSPEVRSREVGRNETTILRSLAAEVSASGVPAVLTLPSLPPDLANSVIQHVARAIKQTPRRWQDDLRPWLSAIERIRKEIATWRPSDSANSPSEDLAASLAELALDVSLSWRDLR